MQKTKMENLKLFYTVCVSDSGTFTKASYTLNPNNENINIWDKTGGDAKITSYQPILKEESGDLQEQLLKAVYNLSSVVAAAENCSINDVISKLKQNIEVL